MDLNDSRPLWIQLAEEFRRRIVSGQWPASTKLPSVRELALELGANPNTVQKALAELDRETLTQTERTAGRFVTGNAGLVNEARMTLAGEATDSYLATMHGLGLARDQVGQLIESRWGQSSERNSDHGASSP